jgi:threonine/homoserine/homoserine lactone efflux protein
MTLQILTAFIVYALVTSVTPGPNNIMLFTSGVHFGLKRTIPHIAGVLGGIMLMVLLVGLGFDAVFKTFPFLYTVLQYIAVAYLLYLSWKIAHAGFPLEATAKLSEKKPMRFLSAAAFQWVNPQAWFGAVCAVGIYVPQDHYFLNVCIIAFMLGLVNLPVTIAWTSGGTVFKRYLAKDSHMRMFNALMALLLLSSIYPIVKKLL